MKTLLLTWLMLSLSALALADSSPVTMNLWPGLAPGEQTVDPGRVLPNHTGDVVRLTDITCPQMQVFGVSGPTLHPAVLVFPGGGYQYLSINSEGSGIAHWLNGLGFVAAVVDYRVPNQRGAAYQDAQRAVSVLRARAKEFGVDPGRVGVIGFSAGGHLAARLSAGSGTRTYAQVDSADEQSCLPDFALLIYPAYLINQRTKRIAPEVEPHRGMPPMFLEQTRDDPFLDAPAYAEALKAVGVPVETAFYPNGHHGYGLRLPITVAAHEWPDRAAAWLSQFEK